MSSVHSENGMPNLFCHFYDPEGFRRKVTTRTANRRISITICTTIERAAKLAATGRLTSEKALKIIRETGAQIAEAHGQIQSNAAQVVLQSQLEKFVKLSGGELESYTVRTWLESWLKRKTDVSKATMIEYRAIVTMFLKFLGARADRALTALQMKQVEEFKADVFKKRSPSTVNKAIKILKSAFSNAVASRQLEFSPAEHIELIQTESTSRRPFTDAELTALLTKASADWRTMILIAFYTGLRLSDCANLTWRNVELHTTTLNVETEKTKRRQDLPLAEPLARHLSKMAGDNPNAPLCPTLFGKPKPSLSGQFYDIMEDAGIVEKRTHKSKGKGRDARRDANTVSFHSLRYNATSALKSAGVSDSVAMDIIGHETASISRNYTKIDDTSKRAAINKMPDITKP